MTLFCKTRNTARIIAFLTVTLLPGRILNAQDYRYGIYISPLISWFKTDIDEVKNEGARAGFDFFITVERNLTRNWSFTSGLGFITSGGRLKSSIPSVFRFPDFSQQLLQENP